MIVFLGPLRLDTHGSVTFIASYDPDSVEAGMVAAQMEQRNLAPRPGSGIQ